MANRIKAAHTFEFRRIHFNLIESLENAAKEHCHEFYELFLIVSGEMRHLVNGSVFFLKTGDLCLLRPDDVHSFARSGQGDCSFLNLALPTDVFAEVCFFLGGNYDPGGYRSAPIMPAVHVPPELSKKMLDCWKRVCGLSPKDETAVMEGKLLTAELLCRVLPPKRKEAPLPGWLTHLRTQMEHPENFSQGMARMEELCGKTKEHISRCFQKYLSTTPSAFLASLRLNYAANLLAGSDRPILEISFDCGYESLSHLYRRFKEEYGLTPAQYRKRYRAIF